MRQLKQLPSPNFGSRGDAKISMLVLHYTGMKSSKEALERLCDKKTQVSAHYVVDEDGSIHQLVDEKNSAWHAGVSYWRGVKNVNNVSIGIEVVNPGHEFGYRPFPSMQMQSVTELCLDIIRRNNIAGFNVIGHSDVAPLRKTDPGELFDWKGLAAKGVGVWPKDIKDILVNTDNYIPKLRDYGYREPQNTEELRLLIEAFQRHFRPSQINGIWDEECSKLLAGLFGMI